MTRTLHGYIVGEYDFTELGCVEHRETFLATPVMSGGYAWLDGECNTCFDEAAFGCCVDEIQYCKTHGKNVGPNHLCCAEAGRLVRNAMEEEVSHDVV